MSLCAVVFDMDGLLLDTEPMYRRASEAAGGEFGVEFSAELYDRLIGLGARDIEAKLLQHFGADFPLSRFRESWRAHWQAEVATTGVTVKSGAIELLQVLQRAGVNFAIATSTPRPRTNELLESSGLLGLFQTVVTGDEVDRGKPAPDIYQLAARRLAIGTKLCVALEDSDAGILAAARAGMTAIMIPDLKPPSAAAAAAAFGVYETLFDAAPVLSELLSLDPRD